MRTTPIPVSEASEFLNFFFNWDEAKTGALVMAAFRLSKAFSVVSTQWNESFFKFSIRGKEIDAFLIKTSAKTS